MESRYSGILGWKVNEGRMTHLSRDEVQNIEAAGSESHVQELTPFASGPRAGLNPFAAVFQPRSRNIPLKGLPNCENYVQNGIHDRQYLQGPAKICVDNGLTFATSSNSDNVTPGVELTTVRTVNDKTRAPLVVHLKSITTLNPTHSHNCSAQLILYDNTGQISMVLNQFGANRQTEVLEKFKDKCTFLLSNYHVRKSLGRVARALNQYELVGGVRVEFHPTHSNEYKITNPSFGLAGNQLGIHSSREIIARLADPPFDNGVYDVVRLTCRSPGCEELQLVCNATGCDLCGKRFNSFCDVFAKYRGKINMVDIETGEIITVQIDGRVGNEVFCASPSRLHWMRHSDMPTYVRWMESLKIHSYQLNIIKRESTMGDEIFVTAVERIRKRI